MQRCVGTPDSIESVVRVWQRLQRRRSSLHGTGHVPPRQAFFYESDVVWGQIYRRDAPAPSYKLGQERQIAPAAAPRIKYAPAGLDPARREHRLVLGAASLKMRVEPASTGERLILF